MRIDLHTHSAVSDGTDIPGVLMAKAAAAGLDVVALTDHDTTAGWSQAQAAADAYGVTLVRGVEISTTNQGHGQHLLAYEPDGRHPGIVALLQAAATSRLDRTPAILSRLAEAGHVLDPHDVARFAGGGVVGKPHIADALVAAGVCADRDEAFDRFLKAGAVGDVRRYQPPIEDAIAVVHAAGGASVIAHPWGRRQVSEERLAELAAAGLVGIEVDHQEHSSRARSALRAIAANLHLVITGSSDHHGTGKVDHDLGCNLTTPDQLDALLEQTRPTAST